MKTAVSIPDDVFEQADQLARERRVSRSELYATALRALIAENDLVTAQLNEVYAGATPDRAVVAASVRSLADTDW